MTDVLADYQAFIVEIEEICARLTLLHTGRMACRRGCNECCTNLSVLPVEFYAAARGIAAFPRREGPREPLFDPAAACGYLRDGACSIYPCRPLICRTHGSPLLYLIEDWTEDAPEWQLSFCDLNFKDIAEDAWPEVFSPENILNMEEANRRLSLINAAFLTTEAGRELTASVQVGLYGEEASGSLRSTGRLPLSSLHGPRGHILNESDL